MNQTVLHKSACRHLLTASIVVLAFAIIGCGTPGHKTMLLTARSRLQIMDMDWRDSAVIPIGTNRQVFYDNAVIARMSTNINRTYGKPTKITQEQPLNMPIVKGSFGAGGYLSVLIDRKDRFRCWYHSGDAQMICHSISTNGIHWVPNGPWYGFSPIVKQPAHGATVMQDAHDGPGAHYYKMVFGNSGRLGTRQDHGVTFAHSRNGISWTDYSEFYPLSDVRSDTGNSMIWDEQLDMYRLCTRKQDMKHGRTYVQYIRPRIRSGFLKTLISSLFIPVMTRPWEPIDELSGGTYGQIYSLYMQKYHSIYIANIMVIRPDGKAIDYYLGFSRNGVNWSTDSIVQDRVFLPRGASGSWDSMMICPPHSPLITMGDQHYIYYSGSPYAHGSAPSMFSNPVYPRYFYMGLAVMRMDSLAFLEVTKDRGFVETKAFQWVGSRFEINADFHKDNLKIEICDMDGRSLTGYESDDCILSASNDCHIKVQWKRPIALIKGRMVKLRFYLNYPAKLYAFQCLP